MLGLQIAERYFNYFGRAMLKEKFPDFECRIAVGLVGEGSDCFQYDDEISHDHDWGPGFCLWLNHIDYEQIGELLQYEYDQLPKEFAGIPARRTTEEGSKRVGVHDINTFYKKFIGLDEPPYDWLEWMRIPETNLAACTNGKVFKDEFGEFSFYRKKLLSFYPDEVRLKKIANRCLTIGKEGQYNIPRCLKRNSSIPLHYATSCFFYATISLVHLLNFRYMPYYKWMYKSLSDLPILGLRISQLIQNLLLANNAQAFNDQIEIIDNICKYIVKELNIQQISNSKSPFLLDHVEIINSNIDNEDIRNYGVNLI